MKRFNLYIFAGLATIFALGSCVGEDPVAPTADRAGITSLTAYFTSGINKDKAAVAWTVDNSAQITDYVIPIPWYYPEESDSTTEKYMSAMRVVAIVENNCTIDPPITTLDLTKKTPFTYTDPYGTQKQITISGQMTKSDKCAIKSFILQPGDVSGVIDEDTKTISLITAGDLSECTAEATLSPHSTISPDPAVAHNYNDGFKFTVTADNGTTTATYNVVQQVPPKISSGIRANSKSDLFKTDLSVYGISSFSNATLACVGNNLVVDAGDGSTPIYLSKVTGNKIGTIALGDANANGCVASDLYGNMLISNFAASGSQLKIYKTSSPTAAPTLYLTYNNGLGLGLGSHIQIQGNLDGDAVITATCAGPYAQHFLRWTVTGGVLDATPKLIKIEGVTQWGGSQAKVVNRSTDVKDGYFVGHYADGNPKINYCDGTTNTVTMSIASSNTDFGDDYGPNYSCYCMDAREFNNKKYLALLNLDYFDWPGSKLYLFDVSNMDNFTGTTVTSNSLYYSQNVTGNVSQASGSGDALLMPSKDGYKLDLYYISGNDMVLGGIEFDCIQK
jgi:hypothetical protein